MAGGACSFYVMPLIGCVIGAGLLALIPFGEFALTAWMFPSVIPQLDLLDLPLAHVGPVHCAPGKPVRVAAFTDSECRYLDFRPEKCWFTMQVIDLLYSDTRSQMPTPTEITLHLSPHLHLPQAAMQLPLMYVRAVEGMPCSPDMGCLRELASSAREFRRASEWFVGKVGVFLKSVRSVGGHADCKKIGGQRFRVTLMHQHLNKVLQHLDLDLCLPSSCLHIPVRKQFAVVSILLSPLHVCGSGMAQNCTLKLRSSIHPVPQTLSESIFDSFSFSHRFLLPGAIHFNPVWIADQIFEFLAYSKSGRAFLLCGAVWLGVMLSCSIASLGACRSSCLNDIGRLGRIVAAFSVPCHFESLFAETSAVTGLDLIRACATATVITGHVWDVGLRGSLRIQHIYPAWVMNYTFFGLAVYLVADSNVPACWESVATRALRGYCRLLPFAFLNSLWINEILPEICPNRAEIHPTPPMSWFDMSKKVVHLDYGDFRYFYVASVLASIMRVTESTISCCMPKHLAMRACALPILIIAIWSCAELPSSMYWLRFVELVIGPVYCLARLARLLHWPSPVSGSISQAILLLVAIILSLPVRAVYRATSAHHGETVSYWQGLWPDMDEARWPALLVALWIRLPAVFFGIGLFLMCHCLPRRVDSWSGLRRVLHILSRLSVSMIVVQSWVVVYKHYQTRGTNKWFDDWAAVMSSSIELNVASVFAGILIHVFVEAPCQHLVRLVV